MSNSFEHTYGYGADDHMAFTNYDNTGSGEALYNVLKLSSTTKTRLEFLHEIKAVAEPWTGQHQHYVYEVRDRAGF